MRFGVSDTTRNDAVVCPKCKNAMEVVARIEPLQKVQGLIAYALPLLPIHDERNTAGARA